MIDRYARAYLAIEKIDAEAAAEMQQSDDPDKTERVKAQAESDMIAAVERTGLAVEEFNQITQLAMLDPALREVIALRVEERRPI